MSHPDDRFHPVPDDDPFWTETCWFTFAVPERKLSGQLYPFLRRNQGVTSSACFLWDDTGSELWDCLYAKNLWHVPLADDARLEALSLPSGLHYECLDDLKRYRLRYLDPDEKRVEIDLAFDALQPPNYLAESHLDQPGRYTGTIRIDEESVPVDAFGFRDRSWGSRSQIGDTLSNSGAPRGGYSYATASESDGFHAITMAFEADACIPIHGYLVRDGEYAKLVPGKGGRDVLERAERDAPTRVRLRGEDELGRSFEAEGRCVNKIGVHLNPNLFTWNCLTEWEWDGGRGWGEDHDNWSAAAATRFFRALRAGAMSLPSDDELRPLFAAWLAKRWPDADDLRVHAFENPKSGFSARTIFVPIEYTRGGTPHAQRVVLRLENPEPAIYPQQAPGLDVEIDIQYRVMEALTQTDCAPLAGLIGYEADASVLGTPFFAMEYVGGDVTIENPPYTQQGFFFEASPDARRHMITEGLRILANVHTIDPAEAGLDWLAHPAHPPGIERQLDLWEAFGRSELGDRVLPVFDEGVAWLRERLPSGLENRFSWGDSRLGNIIFRDARPVCITDFENSAIAPAEFDLGWWLMFDRTMHESVGTARLEGEPTREEQRDLYYAFAGRDLGDTHYYEVLGGFRYTAIVVRVMNRAVERGAVPADHEIWKHNPAAMALRGLLDEAP